MISLAQVPLMLEGDQWGLDWVEKWINPADYVPWTRRAYPGPSLAGITLPTGFQAERPFRLNKFYWPVWGASRWAYGHFLASAQQTDEIREKAYDEDGNLLKEIEFFMDSPGAPSTEFLSTNVFLLPPSPLSCVPIDKQNHRINNLFLLTIVDARYYWWNRKTPVNPVEDSEEDFTWEAALEIAESELDIDIDKDSISSAYLNVSPQLNLSGVPIPPWLDAICYNIGQRLVCRTNGTYLTQRYTKALASRTSDLRDNPDRILMAGGNRFEDEIY